MNFVNLTPHEINVVGGDDTVVATFPASGKVARVQQHTGLLVDVRGIPLLASEFGEVENLPDPQPETIFIVSGLVKGAVKDRRDVASPGDLVRDADGKPIGCRGLIVFVG